MPDLAHQPLELADVQGEVVVLEHAEHDRVEGQALQAFELRVPVQEALRQGIKDFSNWPTIPQLYVKGEFVGGCDIVKEMFESGELKAFLTEKGVTLAA